MKKEFIKNTGFALIFALTFIFAFSGCEEDSPPALPQVTVTGVTVTPASNVIVAKGGTKQFNAVVTGENNPSQTVTWSVDGIAETTITNGLLFIALDETAQTLTVTAASTVDKTKSGTALVTVQGEVTITSISISPSSPIVFRDRTQQFTVLVNGSGNPAQTVTWSVEGGGTGTSIDESGLLKVAANEPSNSLTIKAVSTLFTEKSAVVTAAVENVPQLTGNVTIGGSDDVYQNFTLTVNTDQLEGTGDIGYQWLRAGSASGNFSDIAGAVSAAYILVSADINNYVKVRVTRSNTSGYIDSNIIGPVKAPPSGAANLIEIGIDALKGNDFDGAIKYFDQAYAADKNNPAAIVYSTLGRLASIAVNPDVKNLIQDHIGIKNYPGTINSLINPEEWMAEYHHIIWQIYCPNPGLYNNDWAYWYDINNWWDREFLEERGCFESGYYQSRYYEDFYEFTLIQSTPETWTGYSPGLDVPSWFENVDFYKDTLINVPGNVLKTADTFLYLMLSNFIDRNTNGLNDLLDKLLFSVFGNDFESAYSRIAALNDSVLIKQDLLKAFGLDKIFEGAQIYIGKAELNLVFAAVRLIKASLEWISSYNFNIDLNFLTSAALWDAPEEFFKSFTPSNDNLPFRNDFLKDRKNNRMAQSKTNFTKALDDAIEAYNFWISEAGYLPSAIKNELEEFAWARDEAVKLKESIEGGSSFSYSDEKISISVNFDKFFTSGQLSIDKLIETSGFGSNIKPVFYGYILSEVYFWDEESQAYFWKDEYKWSSGPITNIDQLENYDGFGIKFIFDPLQEIFSCNFINFPAGDEQYLPLFPAEIAEIIWKFYY